MSIRINRTLCRRLIAEAGILSTRAARRKMLAKEIEHRTPAVFRKYRVVDVQATIVHSHTRKAHVRVIPNSKCRRTARIGDYPVCGAIRKATALPGTVRRRLIAAILDAANRNTDISRHTSNLWGAFVWADVPVAPIFGPQPLHDLWYHVAEVLDGATSWDDWKLPAVKP